MTFTSTRLLLDRNGKRSHQCRRAISVVLRVEPLEQRRMLAFASPHVDVRGIDRNANPPDTVGDVGPNHYIQSVNASVYRIHDKSGAVVQGLKPIDSLGTGVCGNGRGDPIVLYDNLADRWLLSEFGQGDNLCVYISQTADPTGDFFEYKIPTPNFPDYPKYAVGNDAYFVGTNEDDNPVYALPRQQMLDGPSATITAIRRTTTDRPNWNRNLIMPVDVDGPAPPAGSPGLYVRQVDDEITNPGGADPVNDVIEVWEFQPDFATPNNSTYNLTTTIEIADFDYNLCDWSRNCLQQPGTSQRIDALPHYIGWRAQYRNFEDYETMLVSFTVDVGVNHAGVRWAEIRKSGEGSWELHQEGTVAPDGDNRWMSSISMNGHGDIGLMYNVTSSTTSPSIRYIGRRVGDPLGTMPRGEHALPGGTGSGFQSTSNRWGDYSAMSVDPTDDASFWFTGMFTQGNGTSATRIGAATFSLLGDFDDDGEYTCADIDGLVTTIAAGTNDPVFDMDGDTVVDLVDRDIWLAEAGEFNLGPEKVYFLGDATLDGFVDAVDFIEWNTNKFTALAEWCSGDFNADGFVDANDFVIWNDNKFQSSDAMPMLASNRALPPSTKAYAERQVNLNYLAAGDIDGEALTSDAQVFYSDGLPTPINRNGATRERTRAYRKVGQEEHGFPYVDRAFSELYKHRQSESTSLSASLII
jgi:hypothetical protein